MQKKYIGSYGEASLYLCKILGKEALAVTKIKKIAGKLYICYGRLYFGKRKENFLNLKEIA